MTPVVATVIGDPCGVGPEVVLKALSTCLLYTSPSPRDKRQSRMPGCAAMATSGTGTTRLRPDKDRSAASLSDDRPAQPGSYTM